MYSQLFCYVEIEKYLTIHKDHFCKLFLVRYVTGTMQFFSLYVKFTPRLSFHLSFFLLIIFLRRWECCKAPPPPPLTLVKNE
jgi:hypothetical protein